MRHVRSVLVSAFAILAAPATATAQSLSYGPVLGRGATADKMIVKWGTSSSGSNPQVSYRVHGATAYQTAAATSSCAHAPSCDYEVVLTGLSASSSYDYYVSTGAASSAMSTFATCPPAGMPLDVIFYGDSRSNPSEHAKVVAQVVAHAPDMVFESGDLYIDGSYAGYLSEFFPAVKTLAAATPFMAAPGNHDASSGDLAGNFGAVFPAPRQQAGDPWQAYYALTCGNAAFIALDSNQPTDAVQKTFLTNQLAAAKADAAIDHVFVWFHHSAYSVGDHGDSTAVKQTWVPLFDDPAGKVTAVFSGHDHIYARMSDASKVTYVVSGGAGAPLYGITGASAGQKVVANATYNFVKLHIVGPMVSGTAYDDAGNIIDTFTMGSSTSDGGTNPADGGANTDAGANSDAGTTVGDGGDSNAPNGGCSCDVSAGAGAPAPLCALAALALALALKRRRRS
jgi:3',5'-cyclic AMP phosphodiesterase CpdA